MWPYNKTEWDSISNPVFYDKKEPSLWKRMIRSIHDSQMSKAKYKIKNNLFL